MKLAIQKTKIRPAFTLPELLIVIAIIAVLATMVAGVLQSAQTDARRAATMSRITQIEAILRTELENFEVRRLPIRLAELRAYVAANPPSGISQNQLEVVVRNLRLQILQDYLNSEFPRPTLLNGQTVFNSGLLGRFPTNAPPFEGGDTFNDWLGENYPDGFELNSVAFPPLRERLMNLASSRIQSFNRIVNRPDAELAFDLPGEYLYAILERIDIDGSSAIDLIGNSAIGNTDNDAFPEIIDAFGEPMQLRIWQVQADEIQSQIFQDVEVFDFDDRSNDGIPLGYQTLDPTIPRELSKIRMEVVSTEL